MSTFIIQDNPENHILASLPEEEYARLLPHLESVPLVFEDLVYAFNAPIIHLYFPTDGVVSMLAQLEGDIKVEVGLIGNEGVVGHSLYLGVESAPNQTVVQAAGHALRIEAAPLRAEFKRGETLHDLLLVYTHMLFTQVAQTASCNRHHPLEERLARWLLMMQDRINGGQSFQFTQEFMSWMLGASRNALSMAASSLQAAKLIEYNRGRMNIRDRPGLEESACGCYAVVSEHYHRYTSV